MNGTDASGRTLQPSTTFLASAAIKDWWICNCLLAITKPPNGLTGHLEGGACVNLSIHRSLFSSQQLLMFPVTSNGRAGNTYMYGWRWFDSIFMVDAYTPTGSESLHGFATALDFARGQRSLSGDNAISYSSNRKFGEDYLKLDNCHAEMSISGLVGDNSYTDLSMNSDFRMLSGLTRTMKLPSVGAGSPPFDMEGKPVTLASLIGPRH